MRRNYKNEVESLNAEVRKLEQRLETGHKLIAQEREKITQLEARLQHTQTQVALLDQTSNEMRRRLGAIAACSKAIAALA